MVFAQFDTTAWVAAMLSNDGKPLFHKASPAGEPDRSAAKGGARKRPAAQAGLTGKRKRP
jgi:hypothetical protein